MEGPGRALLFVLTLGLLWVALVFSLSCLTLLGWAVWPGRARACREALQGSFGRCLSIGLMSVLTFFFLAALADRAGRGGVLALLLLVFYLWQLLAGLPGTFAWLGEAVAALAERSVSTARATVLGCVVLLGTGILPWLGQLLLLAALAATLGSGLLTLARGWRRPVASSPPHE